MAERLNGDFLDWHTDAAKGKKLGFGGTFGAHWFFGQWEDQYIQTYDPSIEYLELYAVTISVLLWAGHIKNRRIVLFCDNQSVVNMVNNTSAKCKNCMRLIRLITSKSLEMNCRIFARWIRGKENTKSDLLSRQKIMAFLKVAKEEGRKTDQYPETLPSIVWPASKIWIR